MTESPTPHDEEPTQAAAELRAIARERMTNQTESQSRRDEGLKPCPLCGGEAAIGTNVCNRQADDAGNYRSFTGYFVNCIHCQLSNCGVAEGHNTRELAAEKWNRRIETSSETKAIPTDLWAGIIEFVEDHADVIDGSDGPRPNRAMQLRAQISEVVRD